MQTKLLYWKSKFIEVWSNGIFRVITICNLAFSFHEGAWKETEKIPWVFIFTFIFIFSETEDIVTLCNDKMMKIMQMLARAYVQALVFSFFFLNKVILMRTFELEFEASLPRERRERGWINCQKYIIDLISFSMYRHFSSTCKWYLLFVNNNFVEK